ncbi:MAG: vWA domain-containing protein [Polyangiales bacterium]
MTRSRLSWFVGVALVMGGCGAGKDTGFEELSDGGDNEGGIEVGDFDVGPTDDTSPDLSALEIEPKNYTLFIDLSKPGSPSAVTYKASVGGTDVTGSATFSVADTSLGSFAGAVFTASGTLPGTSLGVTTIVKGDSMGKSGEAKLTIVKLRKTEDASGKRDFFFTVPYMKAPDPPNDVLKFATNIQKVDVAFVMDTTGSMSGSITNLKTSLTTTVIPGLAVIPSVGLAVVDHKDMSDGAAVLTIRQRVTTDVTKAKAAVGLMSASGGGDEPEAQVAAMDYTLTGKANSPIPAWTPAAGTFGGVEFRPGAVPVVVLITDAHWHDPSGVATTASVTSAFSAHNAKFVGVNVGSKGGAGQADSLSDATKSLLDPSAFKGKCGAGMCCTGYKGAGVAPTGPGGKCRLNFDGGSGDGVSDSIVGAIQAISVGSTYDVKAQISNDPSNADMVDATKFIDKLRAMSEGDATAGCEKHATYDSGVGYQDTFKDVVVGTAVCFEVLPKMNDFVPPKESAQFFNAFIDMIGMPGKVNLGDRRTVVFLVPPKDPGIH